MGVNRIQENQNVKAFDIKIAKPESVYRMSYRLLRNVKIESRLEELKKGIEKELPALFYSRSSF